MAHPDPDYGGVVLPAGRIFSSLRNFSEMRAFMAALESLVSDPDAEIRNWAINLCIGFVTFRDAIAWPEYEGQEE